MQIDNFEGEEANTIQAGDGLIDTVHEFCYLGSVLSIDSSCDKETKTRLGKAIATFGRSIWIDMEDMEEQEVEFASQSQAIRVTGFSNPEIWKRNVVHDSHKLKVVGSCASYKWLRSKIIIIIRSC